jgi:sugar porter (SP) family MFS transporter
MEGDIASFGREALLQEDDTLDTLDTHNVPLNDAPHTLPHSLSSQSDNGHTWRSGASPGLHDDDIPPSVAAQSSKLNRTVMLAALMAALGGFLFGYDVGVISGALLQLEEDFELSDVQKELVVSIMLVGAIAASLVGGYIVDFFGRRDAIVGNAVFFIVGAIVLATAKSYGVLLFGRLLVGFGVSLSAIAEVIYISEIAPPAVRGLLVSLNEMGITVGILVAYGVNYGLITTPGGWRWMFGLSAIPAAIQGAGMLLLPKSPRWLVLKERPYDAQRAMRKVRGSDTSDAELKEELSRMERTLQEQHSIRLSQLLTDPVLRRCLMIACALTLLQQFTGQPNVLYYGSTLFKAAGFESDREATLANMVIGAAKVLATGVALVKVDKLGRRALLLIGVTIMVASLVVLAGVTHAYPPIEIVINATADASNDGGGGRRSLSPAAWGGSYAAAAGLQPWPSCERPDCFQGVEDYQHMLPSTAGNGTEHSLASLSQPVRRLRRRLHPHPEPATALVFENGAVKWTSMVCMVIFVVAYAFSFGPVTWLVLSELFLDDIRGRAVSLATTFNWGGNLVVSLTFLSLLGTAEGDLVSVWMLNIRGSLAIVALISRRRLPPLSSLDGIGFSSTFFMYAGIGVLAFIFIFRKSQLNMTSSDVERCGAMWLLHPLSCVRFSHVSTSLRAGDERKIPERSQRYDEYGHPASR